MAGMHAIEELLITSPNKYNLNPASPKNQALIPAF